MQKESSINAEGIFEPFSIKDVPMVEWHGKDGEVAKFQVLGKFGGGSHVGVGIDELEPGKYSNQFHYHLTEEEHVFILEGSATLYLGDKSYIMSQNDYCCFPAGQKAGHHLYNHTDKLCRFMTIGENKLHDVCFYPQAKLMRIKGSEEVFKIPEK